MDFGIYFQFLYISILRVAKELRPVDILFVYLGNPLFYGYIKYNEYIGILKCSSIYIGNKLEPGLF